MSKSKKILAKIGFSLCAVIFWAWAMVTAILYLPNRTDENALAAFDVFTDFVFFFWLICVVLINFTANSDPRKPLLPISYAWSKTLLPVICISIPALASVFVYIYTFDLSYTVVAAFLFFILTITVIWSSTISKIKWLRRDPAAAEVMKNNAIILYDVKHKVRLDAMPAELFSDPYEIGNNEEYVQAMAYFEYKAYAGEYKEALQTAKRMLFSEPPLSVNSETVFSIKRETLILMTLSDEPNEQIKSFYESLAQHLKTRGKDVPKAAAEYAYFALAANDIEAAKAARARFYTHFDVILHPNDYFEKKFVDEIDKRLTAKHNETPAVETSEA
ncbi:MAG: hypothetical protein LBL87_07855 [Ruminococcus sp.]|jgi:hypothetical protein|nr:hypothetical protein [Ruminococcus sp.]